MGEYKDKTGKTRIGVFLKEVAPELLPLIGSLTGVNVAGNIANIGIKTLGKVSEIIAGSKQLNTAQKAHAQELLNLDILQEQERTKRHAADMASDSYLSKNIRPMTLIFLLAVVTFLCIYDSASTVFNVDQGYISLFTALLLSAFGFYFVGREVNKAILNKKKT